MRRKNKTSDASSERRECKRRAKAGMEEWRDKNTDSGREEKRHDRGRNLEIQQRVEKQVGGKEMGGGREGNVTNVSVSGTVWQ